jgi:hypothetical protein
MPSHGPTTTPAPFSPEAIKRFFTGGIGEDPQRLLAVGAMAAMTDQRVWNEFWNLALGNTKLSADQDADLIRVCGK